MLSFWVNQLPIISSSISVTAATVRLSQIAMPKQQRPLTLSMCCIPWLTSAILLGLVLWSKVDTKLQASRLCLLLLNSGSIICYQATMLYNLLSGRFFGTKLGILRAALGLMGLFVLIICICVAVLPHQRSAVLKANMIEAIVGYAILIGGYGSHVRGLQPIRLTMGVTTVFCLVMCIIAGVFQIRRVVDSVQGGLVTCSWIFLSLSSLFSIVLPLHLWWRNDEPLRWPKWLQKWMWRRSQILPVQDETELPTLNKSLSNLDDETSVRTFI